MIKTHRSAGSIRDKRRHSRKESGGFEVDVENLNRTYGGFRDSGHQTFQRELHKAVCSECGTECQVPFRPKQGLPVYCRVCFSKKKSSQN